MQPRWPQFVFEAIADTPDEAEFLYQRSEALADMDENNRRNPAQL